MKYDTYDAYSLARTQMAERALLTAWDCLAAFQEDLVLIGGLAIRHLTLPVKTGVMEAVTTDVDFGVSLGISNGQYGSLKENLRGHGFRWEQGRFQKEIEGAPVYIDLLTEREGYDQGSVVVDDGLQVSVVPGINRALANHRLVKLEGECLLGVPRKIVVKVAEIGPLLVLKLNAFGGPKGARQQPKDVSDVMYVATRYLDGIDAAVTGFRAEVPAVNSGALHARHALEKHFQTIDDLGPVSCAAFQLNNGHRDPTLVEESLRIRQQCVTLAQALLG